MSFLANSNTISSGAINTGDIGHSLRFRSTATAYLSRTNATAGNRKAWTWSGWVKRGDLGATVRCLFSGLNSATSRDFLVFSDSPAGVIQWGSYTGASYAANKITNAFYRDPTSHLHVVAVWDSANATAADRMRLYLNNERVTSFSTSVDPALNLDSYMNMATLHTIGKDASAAVGYLDGYLSRICFVDGQALTPSSFGYFNTEINEWVSKTQAQVKAVVDAGGTNSFMLEFNDATSLTTLGQDKRDENLLTYSNDFASWGNTNTQIGTAGSNTYANTKLEESTTSSVSHNRSSTAAVTAAGTSLTATVYVKAAERGYAYIQINDGSSSNASRVFFNLTTGAVSSGPSDLVGTLLNKSASSENLGNGEWRLRFSFTLNSVANAQMYVGISNDGSTATYAGAVGSGIYIGRAQLETGSTATTYFATTTTARSRNNWTLNSFSITPGSTYDHMLDVPGNSFATLNPIGNNAGVSASFYMSEANLALTVTNNSGYRNVEATFSPEGGKGYFEIHHTAGSPNGSWGVQYQSITPTNTTYTTTGTFRLAETGSAYNGSTLIAACVSAIATTDVTMVAYDFTSGNRNLWFGKNGTWGSNGSGTGNPETGAYPIATISNITEMCRFFFAQNTGGGAQTTNYLFGQAPLHASATYDSASGGYFRYAPPTGFKALCQANLSATGTVIVSGTFTGNASADGPFVWMNGVPKTLTINSNAVTFGTHADKLATGFKLRTSSASYNASGSNNWTATVDSDLQNIFKYNNAEGNP